MNVIAWRDGVPDVAGLDVDTILGPDGGEYMHRHHLTDRVRFHHLLTDDGQPDMHDHPWDFDSLLVTGAYLEQLPDGVHVEHRAPTLIRRRAEQPHRLELLDGPMWTLVATGPVRRRWGFHTADGWVHWTHYERAGRYLDALDDASTRPRRAREWL